MDRRRFVTALGLIAGNALTPARGVEQALTVAQDYRNRAAASATSYVFFDAHEMRSLRKLCDLVIPRTETPGAIDVDVHGFIDNQIHYCHSEEEQQGASGSLAALDRVAQTRFRNLFADSEIDDQLKLLLDIEAAAPDFETFEIEGFRFLKSMVVFGYFTSEAGATLELAFDPYPGKFVGSVPYDDIGRAWFKG